jgi:hypothetical protein
MPMDFIELNNFVTFFLLFKNFGFLSEEWLDNERINASYFAWIVLLSEFEDFGSYVGNGDSF